MNTTFLHWIGDTLREQLMQVPLLTARCLFVGFLLLMMGWVVQLPASQATPPDRRCEWYEDLRIWAWLALMFQVIVYCVF